MCCHGHWGNFWTCTACVSVLTAVINTFILTFKIILRLLLCKNSAGAGCKTEIRLAVHHAAFHSALSVWYSFSREGTWGHFANPFFPLPHQGRNKPLLPKNLVKRASFFLLFSQQLKANTLSQQRRRQLIHYWLFCLIYFIINALCFFVFLNQS